jgi:Flp pilus assembly pilin Flp
MAEYAVVLVVILAIVVGTLRLVGSNTNNAFSSVVSSLLETSREPSGRPEKAELRHDINPQC